MTRRERRYRKRKAPMTYGELEARGMIRKTNIQPEEVVAAYKAATEELSAAKLLLQKNYPTQSFRLAVESMIMSGMALVYREGYRPRARAIIALVHFAEINLGPEHRNLINRFDYFRQHRNTRAFYVMGRFDPQVEPHLTKEALDTAQELLIVTKELLAS